MVRLFKIWEFRLLNVVLVGLNNVRLFFDKKKVFFYKNKCKNWNVKVKKNERDKVFCNVYGNFVDLIID